LYKTKMCDKYQRDGECPYGIKCVFAHGEHELRSREPANPLYKTQMCQRFTELGECPYGEKCQFAH
ncbi:hypothetical protein DL89DRAFT_216496, partial [Linderina pennispora]